MSWTQAISTGADSYTQIMVSVLYDTVVCGAHVIRGKELLWAK